MGGRAPSKASLRLPAAGPLPTCARLGTRCPLALSPPALTPAPLSRRSPRVAMADSAAATAAAPAAVKGSSSAGHWWKSLTGKKKHKEAAAASPPPAEPPAATPNAGSPEEPPPALGSGEHPGVGGGARRSLRVSHSGRFKERRKVRTSLLADGPEVFDGAEPGRAAPEGK